jgi:Serine endopeptidase inhibitors
MPTFKIDDLAPTPFFARFLEGQPTELTPEQMRNLRGGASEVTMAAPSDGDYAEVKPSPFPGFDTSKFPFDMSQFPCNVPALTDPQPGMWPCRLADEPRTVTSAK